MRKLPVAKDLKYLIEDGEESFYLDFKREMKYKGSGKKDFLKDVMSFANSIESFGDECYIIIGVQEIKGKRNSVLGVNLKKDINDISTYQNWLRDNIEPSIPLDIQYQEIQGKNVACFIIGPCIDPPYVMKKDYIVEEKKEEEKVVEEKKKKKDQNLREGDIWIRQGTSNRRALRRDLDCMYEQKKAVRPKDIIIGFNTTTWSKEKEISPITMEELEESIEFGGDGEKKNELIYDYWRTISRPFNLYILNTGSESLEDCEISLVIEKLDPWVYIDERLEDEDLYCSSFGSFRMPNFPPVRDPRFHIERREDEYIIS